MAVCGYEQVLPQLQHVMMMKTERRDCFCYDNEMRDERHVEESAYPYMIAK